MGKRPLRGLEDPVEVLGIARSGALRMSTDCQGAKQSMIGRISRLRFFKKLLLSKVFLRSFSPSDGFFVGPVGTVPAESGALTVRPHEVYLGLVQFVVCSAVGFGRTMEAHIN